MSVVQSTLEGKETDTERERPATFMWCPETEQWVLRSRRAEWPHELYEDKAAFIDSLNEGEKEIVDETSTEYDIDDEPERVGSIYEIELSYNVDYRFRVPAWSEHEAEDYAKELVLESRPTDSMHVHTNRRELKELFEDSAIVPDDFDPYAGTPLWEAIEEADDGE